MKYVSTRGGSPIGLDRALQTGLAPDGGLYVPVEMPTLQTADWPLDDLHEVAGRYLQPFMADSAVALSLSTIVRETFSFPLPVVEIGERPGHLGVLELFHGPTAAFKDVGARFLAACLTRLDAGARVPLTILVATSGDTGGAVAAAFHGRPGVQVVVLFPEGRVSPRQQHQLTCWGGNVMSIAVQGSFDDCQRLVKAAFVDEYLSRRHRLSSANSINIGRLLPQSVYYAWASLRHHRRHGRALSFAIPTGNLGNGLAAVLARAAGMPIGDILFVTNANQTLGRYFASGDATAESSVATLASAMDVGAPSNLERLRRLFGEAEQLRNQRLDVTSVSDDEIRAQIRADHGVLPFDWCPHSATARVAWLGLPEARRKGDWCLVATAHPAKFETIVEPLTGATVPVPEALSALLERPVHYHRITPTLAALGDTLDHLGEESPGTGSNQ